MCFLIPLPACGATFCTYDVLISPGSEAPGLTGCNSQVQQTQLLSPRGFAMSKGIEIYVHETMLRLMLRRWRLCGVPERKGCQVLRSQYVRMEEQARRCARVQRWKVSNMTVCTERYCWVSVYHSSGTALESAYPMLVLKYENSICFFAQARQRNQAALFDSIIDVPGP